MPKMLVTGGAGFIGSHLVNRLCAAGHDVEVLDDFSSGFRANLDGLPVRVHEGDVRDAAAVERAAAGVHTIFHLAASVGNLRSIEHPADDAAVNVLGTVHVLEAARRGGARNVVFSSSAGIFGEVRRLPIAEDHPAEPDSPYGASKLGAEKVCLAYSRLYAMDVVCLRYFNVYGRRQHADAYGNVIPIFADRILRGEPVTIHGDGEQTRDFVHVNDVVEANLLAAEAAGVSGAFNIGSGTGISINDLVALMYDVAGVPPALTHGPVRPGDVKASVADIAAARRAFGFAPATDLREGVRDYFVWMKALASACRPG